MSGELNEIIKPFKYLFIVIIVEFVLCSSFFIGLFSSYDKNLFEVSVNNVLMNCYYSEKYNNGFIIQANTQGYNSVENRINSVDLSNNMKLDLKEFEVYYKSGSRKSDTNGWLRQNNLEYKQIDNHKINMEIKRMNKTIYDGEFISDLSSYLNENGRYYIHLYTTRKDGIFTSVKTHISFNVIVGGGNRD